MAKGKKSPVVVQSENSIELAELNPSYSVKQSQEQNSVAETERSHKVEREKSVSEKPLTLDQWAESIISDKQKKSDAESDKDYRPTVNLSRFGLKTPEDVKKFLHSPAGEAVIGEMGAKLAFDKAIVQEQRLEQQEHRLLMSRLKALLFSWFLAEKADASERVKELILQYNELSRERAKPVTSSQKIPDTKRNLALEESLAKYAEAVKRAQDNIAKGEALDKQMEKLIEEGKHLEAKYNIYDTSLAEFENSPAARITLTADEIQDQLDQLAPEMNDDAQMDHDVKMAHDAKMAHVKMAHDALKSGNVHEARGLLLKAQISQLAVEMSKMAGEINELKDDEVQIQALVDRQVGINLKAASLHDLLAVHEGKKIYVSVNDKGEQVQVHDVQKAEFILSKDQKLVKDEEGKLHLLQPHQDWESVKNNTEAKALARKDYKELKPQIMCVKKVVSRNKGLETTMNQEQVAETDKLIKENKAEGLVIVNMNTLQQSARSSVQSELSQPDLGRVISRPTPTSGQATTPRPSQASATLFYREQIQQLKQAQQVNYEQLHGLADNLPPGPNLEAAKNYLKNMPRTGNIPYQSMQNILRNMERFGIDATKPSVTSITNPSEKAEITNSMTPLSMMPDPTRR